MRICIRVGKLARIVTQDKSAWFVPALFDVHGLAESFPVSARVASPVSVKAMNLFHCSATDINSGPLFGLEILVAGVCFTIF